MNKLKQLMERKKARILTQAEKKIDSLLPESDKFPEEVPATQEQKDFKVETKKKPKKKKKGFFSL